MISPADVASLFPIGDLDQKIAETGQKQIANGYARGAAIELERVNAVSKQFTELPESLVALIQQTIEDVFGFDYWLANVATQTRNLVSQKVMSVIRQGLGAQELARQLREESGHIFGRVRAIRIARTETTAALNGGQFLVGQEHLTDGITAGREWLATVDNVTRSTHIKADGQKVRGNELFRVGTELARYPADPMLSAKERVNCRCAMVHLLPEEFED